MTIKISREIGDARFWNFRFADGGSHLELIQTERKGLRWTPRAMITDKGTVMGTGALWQYFGSQNHLESTSRRG